MKHKQRKVTNPRTEKVLEVDAKLATWLIVLWYGGFTTYCSCQEIATGVGYINLANSRHAAKLLSYCSRVADVSLLASKGLYQLQFKTKDIRKLTQACAFITT